MAYAGSQAIIGRGTTFGIGPVAGATVPTGVTGTTTSGSTSVTAVSSVTGLTSGMTVSGTGIAAGTTIAGVGTTTITLSQPATASGTAVSLTFGIGYSSIGEDVSYEPSGREWDIEDVTNFQSNVDKEKIKALRNPGEFTLSYNLLFGDAGQTALRTAFDSTSAYMFQLTFPLPAGKTTPETWTFNALVVQIDPKMIEPGKTIHGSCKLQVTGPRTITPAS